MRCKVCEALRESHARERAIYDAEIERLTAVTDRLLEALGIRERRMQEYGPISSEGEEPADWVEPKAIPMRDFIPVEDAIEESGTTDEAGVG